MVQEQAMALSWRVGGSVMLALQHPERVAIERMLLYVEEAWRAGAADD